MAECWRKRYPLTVVICLFFHGSYKRWSMNLLTSRLHFHFRALGCRWRSAVLCSRATRQEEGSEEYWSYDFKYCPV